jgi:hypothetical protein
MTAYGSNKTEAVPSGQLGTAVPIPATVLARNDLTPGTRNWNVSVCRIFSFGKTCFSSAPNDSLRVLSFYRRCRSCFLLRAEFAPFCPLIASKLLQFLNVFVVFLMRLSGGDKIFF